MSNMIAFLICVKRLVRNNRLPYVPKELIMNIYCKVKQIFRYNISIPKYFNPYFEMMRGTVFVNKDEVILLSKGGSTRIYGIIFNIKTKKFKGLGEISPDEFKHFIGDDIRLDPVMLDDNMSIEELLSFYMGKNTPSRQEFIIDNLKVEMGLIDEK